MDTINKIDTIYKLGIEFSAFFLLCVLVSGSEKEGEAKGGWVGFG